MNIPPVGKWGVSIPPGRCAVAPSPINKYVMLIVPVRLDSTDEVDEEFHKALGTEIPLTIVFVGPKINPRLYALSKERLLRLCEATGIDLSLIPKRMSSPEEDLQPLIRALEGRQFAARTRRLTRDDTGEIVVDLYALEAPAISKVLH